MTFAQDLLNKRVSIGSGFYQHGHFIRRRHRTLPAINRAALREYVHTCRRALLNQRARNALGRHGIRYIGKD
jgi:hypothetical protein